MTGPTDAEQARRTASLRRAEAVKEARGQLRQRIKTGEVGFLDVIEGNVQQVKPFRTKPQITYTASELIGRLRVGYVLLSIPGIGPVAKDEILAAMDPPISSEVKMKRLSLEQRAKLAQHVETMLRYRGLM